MSFSKIFQILFIVGSTFLIFIPEYLNNSWWCFSSSFSTFEDRRRVPLQSNPFSQRCVVLTCCRPLIIVLSVRIFFHPSGAIQESFQFDSLELIISELFILSFQLSLSNSSSASFKYYLVSSGSLCSLVSKFSQVSSFIF